MESRKHLFHYFVLFLLVAAGFFFFLRLRFYPKEQFVVVVLVDAGYVLWGLLHHYLEGRFGLRIVAEYLLVGAIVLLAFALTLGLA